MPFSIAKTPFSAARPVPFSIANSKDDQERIARFKLVLATTGLTLTCSRTAQDFIRQYQAQTEVPKLIALDHDLFTDNENDPGPGDGRDVAAFLATQSPIAPILIHSTNAVRQRTPHVSARGPFIDVQIPNLITLVHPNSSLPVNDETAF